MTYRGVQEGSRATVIGPYATYRPVLDEARSWAFSKHVKVVIVNDDSGLPEMIVHPDGRCRRPRYRS